MIPVFDLFQMVTVLVIRPDASVVDDDDDIEIQDASVVDDDDDIEIQIREHRINNLHNGFSQEITVKGKCRPKTVTATKFTSGCHYGGRPATLKVYVNGVYSGKCLLPSDFVDHVKIIFNVGAGCGGELRLTSICGVPAESSDAFTSLGVFNIFGPSEYEGRPHTCIHRE